MNRIGPVLVVSREEREAHFRAQLARVRAKGWSGEYPYTTSPREWTSPYSPALVARRTEIEADLERIDWPLYRTAYSDATPVVFELERLMFGDVAAAMSSASNLWSALCHQHAYVSSAALPAYPFIALALAEAPELLAVEILDVVRGFVLVEIDEFGIDRAAWHASLRNAMVGDRDLYVRLASHENEDVRDFAQEIIDTIAS